MLQPTKNKCMKPFHDFHFIVPDLLQNTIFVWGLESEMGGGLFEEMFSYD